jgi:cyclic pyranopterin phosphate synthase
MHESTAASIAANSMKKGDVLGAARYAGLQAAKNAASMLPLCDQVLVRATAVEFSQYDDAVEIETTVESFDGVGMEMQALSAANAAALTIYDMCKSADRTMTIGPVALIERSGDSATDWRREDDDSGE